MTEADPLIKLIVLAIASGGLLFLLVRWGWEYIKSKREE